MKKMCQSCMMPMNEDPEGGGTDFDGEKSLKYCSYCYQNGRFTQPHITAEQMRSFVVEKMVEMKFPRFVAKLLTLNFNKLERWKKK